MTECFDVAAVRHFRDGDFLREQQCLDNADQLFGFAAECAIKSALVTLPGCLQDDGLAKKYKEHVDQLWDLAALQSLQKRYRGLSVLLEGSSGRSLTGQRTSGMAPTVRSPPRRSTGTGKRQSGFLAAFA